MSNIHILSKGAESLTAILNDTMPPELEKAAGIHSWTPNSQKRSAGLQYKDRNGNITTLVMANGRVTTISSICAYDGKKYDFGAWGYIHGLKEILKELKQKVPGEWYPVFGLWFGPENGQEADTRRGKNA